MADNYQVLEGQSYFGFVIIFLASLVEELGWRGYGIDSLRSRFNLWNTALLFASFWALWHIPLFFINGYYQNQLWKTSVIYVVNFFISIFPAALLLNWVYYKNNRNIIAAFLLHLMLNITAVLFKTEQPTKCIMTLLLLIVSGIIVWKDKKFFFER